MISNRRISCAEKTSLIYNESSSDFFTVCHPCKYFVCGESKRQLVINMDNHHFSYSKFWSEYQARERRVRTTSCNNICPGIFPISRCYFSFHHYFRITFCFYQSSNYWKFCTLKVEIICCKIKEYYSSTVASVATVSHCVLIWKQFENVCSFYV